MNNGIYEIFQEGFDAQYFKRVGESNHNMYVGKNAKGKYAFEYRGDFTPIRVKGSDLISVEQYKSGDSNVLCFSLESNELLERFSIFCQDLVDSVQMAEDEGEGYKVMCDRFFSWKKLFKPNQANLSEPEIMGLIGELLFLGEEMIPYVGEVVAVNSWMGPEKTHKDFSFDDKWVEVKAVSAGKDSIRISSIEQLDGHNAGSLVVYRLELMSNTFNGIKLNALVNDILRKINNSFCRDLFISKLESYGYDWSPEYENRVYNVTDIATYAVSMAFPVLRRANLPQAIGRVQYDLLATEIESFKREKPWK